MLYLTGNDLPLIIRLDTPVKPVLLKLLFTTPPEDCDEVDGVCCCCCGCCGCCVPDEEDEAVLLLVAPCPPGVVITVLLPSVVIMVLPLLLALVPLLVLSFCAFANWEYSGDKATIAANAMGIAQAKAFNVFNCDFELLKLILVDVVLCVK
jgi:hypothetical protein